MPDINGNAHPVLCCQSTGLCHSNFATLDIRLLLWNCAKGRQTTPILNYHTVEAGNPLPHTRSAIHRMHAPTYIHATYTCMHPVDACNMTCLYRIHVGTCLQHGSMPRGNTSRVLVTCRKVSMMAGPWVVRMCLDRPCRDMLRKASRVRGRFSAIRLTCLRPRKAFLGEMIAMVCSKAFITMARWHCSSCSRCSCQDQHSMDSKAWHMLAEGRRASDNKQGGLSIWKSDANGSTSW